MIITHIKKTYVIFICLKDVFGKNLPIYTFNNICEQNHSLTLGDEATKVIVNAEGSRDDLSENMRSFLDYLIEKKATKEQTEAITQTEGNIRVASVPGSGKTFVLTYRIAYLITELFVEPSSIVALTFTNKAASQMKHRLRNIVGDNANCFTGTFHGYCNMFLKEEIHRLTFPKTFTILDKKAELEMIKDVAEDMGISLKDNTAKKIMSDIDITKQDMSYVELMAGVDKTELKRRASSEKNVDKKVFYNYLKRQCDNCLLYTSDAADEEDSVEVGGSRILKKKNNDILGSIAV